MLVSNELAVLFPYFAEEASLVRNQGIRKAEIRLDYIGYSGEELRDHLAQLPVEVIGLRVPDTEGLGARKLDLEGLKRLIREVGEALSPHPAENRRMVIGTQPVAITDIFAYMDHHPNDFTALVEYKEEWLERAIEQASALKREADQAGLQLLLENAPICGMYFFEPGEGKIYPALRTPDDLLKTVEETGVGLCFHSGYARMASNLFTYMKRSRSLFAGATEAEVFAAPVNWILFYERVASHVRLVHLSDCIGLGDTLQTRHAPFRKRYWDELESFVSLLPHSIPIVLDLPSYDPELSKDYHEFMEAWRHQPSM